MTKFIAILGLIFGAIFIQDTGGGGAWTPTQSMRIDTTPNNNTAGNIDATAWDFLQANQGDWTVEMWVRGDDDTSTTRTLVANHDNATWCGVFYGESPTGDAKPEWRQNGAGPAGFTHGFMDQDTWTHIAIANDDSDNQAALYVNGSLVADDAFSSGGCGSANIDRITVGANVGGEYAEGNIFLLRTWTVDRCDSAATCSNLTDFDECRIDNTHAAADDMYSQWIFDGDTDDTGDSGYDLNEMDTPSYESDVPDMTTSPDTTAGCL